MPDPWWRPVANARLTKVRHHGLPLALRTYNPPLLNCAINSSTLLRSSAMSLQMDAEEDVATLDRACRHRRIPDFVLMLHSDPSARLSRLAGSKVPDEVAKAKWAS